MAALLEMVAPDVVMVGDGGGKAWAIARPLSGAEQVVRLVLGLYRRAPKMGVHIEPAWLNGQPGGISYDGEGRVVNVFVLDIADGLVQTVRSIVNPDKLHHLGPVSDVALRAARDLTCRPWPPTSPRKPRPTRSSTASRRRRTRGCANC
jgi:RNA polymerase sigma-70 factor (ECF subfamily)